MNIFITFRSRLVASAAFLAVLLIFSQIYSYYSIRLMVEQEAERNLQHRAQLFESGLSEEQQELKRYAAFIRDNLRIQEYLFVVVNFDSGQEVIPELYKQQFSWLPIDRVMLIGKNGVIVLGAQHHDLHKAVLERKSVTTKNSSFYFYGSQGLELVTWDHIVYKNKEIGEVVISRIMNNKWLQIQQEKGAGHVVINKDDVIQVSTIAEQVGRKFSSKNDRIVSQNEEFRLFKIALPGLDSSHVNLFFAVSLQEFNHNLGKAKHRSQLLSGFGVAIILLIVVLLGRNFHKPLSQLAALTKEVAAGRLPQVTKVDMGSEVGILTNQFADMVQSLRQKEKEVLRAHEELERTATTDALTGLFNRRAFEAKIDKVIENARMGKKTHALCYLDLDQFKIVNDTCGHAAGDQLLVKLTSLLNKRVRGTDVLARLGGDEFGMLLNNLNESGALKAADDILKMINAFKFIWNNQIFEIGVSIGIVMVDEHTLDRAAVLQQADTACYTAKNEGRNRIKIFHASDEMLNRIREDINWVQRIREALRDNRFQIWLQEIISLHSAMEVKSYEVLVRLLNPDGTLVSPSIFIPTAERYQIMPLIDRWVIENTFKCIQQTGVKAQFNRFFINLSGMSFAGTEMLDFILEKFREYHVSPHLCCFEITETAAIRDLDNALNLMSKLKEHGALFALDDFGSGLSTFRYIKELPVDFIKIDGSFITNIAKNPIDLSILDAINKIAHLSGKGTIAEHIETKEILNKVMEMGIDYAQGYYWGQPVPFWTIFKQESLDSAVLAPPQRLINA